MSYIDGGVSFNPRDYEYSRLQLVDDARCTPLLNVITELKRKLQNCEQINQKNKSVVVKLEGSFKGIEQLVQSVVHANKQMQDAMKNLIGELKQRRQGKPPSDTFKQDLVSRLKSRCKQLENKNLNQLTVQDILDCFNTVQVQQPASSFTSSLSGRMPPMEKGDMHLRKELAELLGTYCKQTVHPDDVTAASISQCITDLQQELVRAESDHLLEVQRLKQQIVQEKATVQHLEKQAEARVSQVQQESQKQVRQSENVVHRIVRALSAYGYLENQTTTPGDVDGIARVLDNFAKARERVVVELEKARGEIQEQKERNKQLEKLQKEVEDAKREVQKEKQTIKKQSEQMDAVVQKLRDVNLLDAGITNVKISDVLGAIDRANELHREERKAVVETQRQISTLMQEKEGLNKQLSQQQTRIAVAEQQVQEMKQEMSQAGASQNEQLEKLKPHVMKMKDAIVRLVGALLIAGERLQTTKRFNSEAATNILTRLKRASTPEVLSKLLQEFLGQHDFIGSFNQYIDNYRKAVAEAVIVPLGRRERRQIPGEALVGPGEQNIPAATSMEVSTGAVSKQFLDYLEASVRFTGQVGGFLIRTYPDMVTRHTTLFAGGRTVHAALDTLQKRAKAQNASKYDVDLVTNRLHGLREILMELMEGIRSRQTATLQTSIEGAPLQEVDDDIGQTASSEGKNLITPSAAGDSTDMEEKKIGDVSDLTLKKKTQPGPDWSTMTIPTSEELMHNMQQVRDALMRAFDRNTNAPEKIRTETSPNEFAVRRYQEALRLVSNMLKSNKELGREQIDQLAVAYKTANQALISRILVTAFYTGLLDSTRPAHTPKSQWSMDNHVAIAAKEIGRLQVTPSLQSLTQLESMLRVYASAYKDQWNAFVRRRHEEVARVALEAAKNQSMNENATRAEELSLQLQRERDEKVRIRNELNRLQNMQNAPKQQGRAPRQPVSAFQRQAAGLGRQMEQDLEELDQFDVGEDDPSDLSPMDREMRTPRATQRPSRQTTQRWTDADTTKPRRSMQQSQTLPRPVMQVGQQWGAAPIMKRQQSASQMDQGDDNNNRMRTGTSQ